MASASSFVGKLNDLFLEVEAVYIERAAIAERDAAIDRLQTEANALQRALDKTIDRRIRRLIARITSR